MSWAEGEYNVLCCSLELLIYSVGDLTISILSSKCGGRKAPFGFPVILCIILHQFSYARTAFGSEALRFPSENPSFYVFVCCLFVVSPCPVTLWFLLATMPGACDTLQRDIQGRDGVAACSLPRSVPREQRPFGCRAGTPIHEACHTEDTRVPFPRAGCCCSSSMRFAEHPQLSFHPTERCWLKCLFSCTEGPSESLCWFRGDSVHPFFLCLWSMGVVQSSLGCW